MMIRLLPLAFLLCAAVASAAPVRPFPVVPHGGADWWRGAPSIAVGPARLALAWDSERLYAHVSDAPSDARFTLDGWFTARAKGGVPSLERNGGPIEGAVIGAGADGWNASIPWSALGVSSVERGRFLPMHILWSAGGKDGQLPGPVLGFNPLTWGVVELAADASAEGRPSTLTKPLVYRFDPSAKAGKPVLTVSPEPLAGLCLPVEVDMRSVGAEERVVQTRHIAGGAARLEIPKVDTPFAGFVIRVPGYAGETGEAAYNCLAPGRKICDFTGSANWPVPADFDAHWKRALDELNAVPMNARVTPVPAKNTATGELYRVDLDSVGGVRFSGWYYVPRGARAAGATAKYPAVQIMPGYGAEEPPLDRTAQGYITFSVNPRGHGPSADFWPLPADHLAWNIEDPDKHYYRGAYMDCVRAIQFLQAQPEVKADAIGVEGGSQGGAFALATAALAKGVTACVANIPFLSDIPSAVHLVARGGMASLRERFEKDPVVRKTLSYIDVSHLATRIHCPTLVCVGEMDRACPPAGGMSDYHALPAGTVKRIQLFPGREHEVPNDMREANAEWFKRYLKLSPGR